MRKHERREVRTKARVQARRRGREKVVVVEDASPGQASLSHSTASPTPAARLPEDDTTAHERARELARRVREAAAGGR